MISFKELLDWHEEFVFYYDDIKYEIVNENGISIFLSDDKHGTLLQSFKNKDELLKKGLIKGKKISEIINEIKVF